jgi:hypothetical protein
VNSDLSANLKQAVIECEEKGKHISELEEAVKNLLDKLNKSGQNFSKVDALKTLNYEELASLNMKNKSLVLENKAQRKDFKDLKSQFVLLKHEGLQSKKKLESRIDSHPEFPYLLTDPLPPIFSSQLCLKSRTIHFLSSHRHLCGT